MRLIGWLMALFGGGGLVSGTLALVHHTRHVEPIGLALLGFIALGGVLLIRVGGARAVARRASEIAVLAVAKKHRGSVSAVLVAAEGGLTVAVAERELGMLAERGVCVRRSDDAGAVHYVFPELENEQVKQELFFDDAPAQRTPRGQDVRR